MNKLIVLAGPTAVGKTALSIELAKRINGEIISCDSMQVYKEMNIGSAKISKNDMDGIKHYLVDEIDPKEDFNVYIFQKMAKKAIESIYANNKVPILVGGTGFYIQSVIYDINFTEENNTDIRKELELRAKNEGNLSLFSELNSIDPEYAKTLHPNNVKKVIRALEYFKLNNKLFSEHNKEEALKESPYDLSFFVLNDLRDKLYKNIDDRVEIMFENGLVDEVKNLRQKGLTKDYISMQGLGYKELLDYFDGLLSLEEAKDKIKLETRHFAKRQLTWFRREKNIIWINKNEFNYNNDLILDFMLGEINK